MKYVPIGNGLYTRSVAKTSLLEACRKLQDSCAHEKRDPSGMCYRCGHRVIPEKFVKGDL